MSRAVGNVSECVKFPQRAEYKRVNRTQHNLSLFYTLNRYKEEDEAPLLLAGMRSQL